jgi:hypothetical protein
MADNYTGGGFGDNPTNDPTQREGREIDSQKKTGFSGGAVDSSKFTNPLSCEDSEGARRDS